jgi:hypothetical protein
MMTMREEGGGNKSIRSISCDKKRTLVRLVDRKKEKQKTGIVATATRNRLVKEKSDIMM